MIGDSKRMIPATLNTIMRFRRGETKAVSYTHLDVYKRQEYTSMHSFWNTENMFVYNDVLDASGNVVVKANRNAKYPKLRWSSVNSVTSTFWRVSGTPVSYTHLGSEYNIQRSCCR